MEVGLQNLKEHFPTKYWITIIHFTCQGEFGIFTLEGALPISCASSYTINSSPVSLITTPFSKVAMPTYLK
jgi:hypothetical protein